MVLINIIAEDPTGEFALYLVEEAPWEPIEPRLRQLQDRLYDAFEVAVDGHLAKKYPESIGRAVRIQVDAYDSPPEKLFLLVEKFAKSIVTNGDHRLQVINSAYITSIRVVAERGLITTIDNR